MKKFIVLSFLLFMAIFLLSANEVKKVLMIAGNDTTKLSYTQKCPYVTFIVENDTIICSTELVDKYGSEMILQACVNDTAILDTTKYEINKGFAKYQIVDSVSCLINVNNEIIYKRLLLKQSNWMVDNVKIIFTVFFGLLIICVIIGIYISLQYEFDPYC